MASYLIALKSVQPCYVDFYEFHNSPFQWHKHYCNKHEKQYIRLCCKKVKAWFAGWKYFPISIFKLLNLKGHHSNNQTVLLQVVMVHFLKIMPIYDSKRTFNISRTFSFPQKIFKMFFTLKIKVPKWLFFHKITILGSQKDIIPLFHQGSSSAGSEPEPSFKPVLCLSTPKAPPPGTRKSGL